MTFKELKHRLDCVPDIFEGYSVLLNTYRIDELYDIEKVYIEVGDGSVIITIN